MSEPNLEEHVNIIKKKQLSEATAYELLRSPVKDSEYVKRIADNIHLFKDHMVSDGERRVVYSNENITTYLTVAFIFINHPYYDVVCQQHYMVYDKKGVLLRNYIEYLPVSTGIKIETADNSDIIDISRQFIYSEKRYVSALSFQPIRPDLYIQTIKEVLEDGIPLGLGLETNGRSIGTHYQFNYKNNKKILIIRCYDPEKKTYYYWEIHQRSLRIKLENACVESKTPTLWVCENSDTLCPFVPTAMPLDLVLLNLAGFGRLDNFFR